MKNKALPFALLALLPACTSTSEGVKDPAGYEGIQKINAKNRRQIGRDAKFAPKVMQGFDKMIDKYFRARVTSPDPRATRLRDTLDFTLRRECRKNFDFLLTMADDDSNPEDRNIALVALGFTDDNEIVYKKRNEDGTLTKQQIEKQNAATRHYTEMALNSMVSALRSENDGTVENALLGIGLLANENTPIPEIGALAENDKRSLDIRRNATWALAIMQDKLTPNKAREIRPIFSRILSQPLGDVEPPIVCHSIRSIGRYRNGLDAKIIEPYTKHPTALVRARAAIALGQIKNESSIPALLELIQDKEDNQNVRLAAHKSLKALAGGRDRGYDVKAWKKLFTLK